MTMNMNNGVISRWALSMRAAGRSERTIGERVRILQASRLDPTSCTIADLEEWLGSHPEWTQATRRAYIDAVRGCVSWCHERGLRADNPSTALPSIRLPKGRPRPITTGDLQILLAAAKRRRMRGYLLLAAFAGLRAAEIAAAERKHLHGSWIEVTGKGGKVRAVDAHHLVAEQYRAGQPYVFPRLDGLGGAATPWLVSQHVNRHLHGLGVDATCHQLRHWFATNLYQQTQDILLTQNMLGHSSPKTTAVYADYNHDGPTVELLPAVA